MLKDIQLKVIVLTAIGGALEFYDFTIYALFAPYLSYHFFPKTNSLIALINTFAVFAVGYLMRPLGGIVFGHIGDKFGRKHAFTLTIFLMATATLLMGCLPSYQSIGILAPLLLVSLRLLQGFSVGGEIPGTIVFTMEHIAMKNWGLTIGFLFMCITFGNTLGAGVGFILTTFLSIDAMLSWGWRIPFILGFFLGIISFIIRIKTVETPVFISIQREEKIYKLPVLTLLQTKSKLVIIGFLITAVSASTVSLFLYLPSYLSTVLNIKISHVYLINLFAFFIFGLVTAFFGWLSDFTGRKELMVLGALLLILLDYWLFYGLSVYGSQFVWIFILSFAILAGMLNGCYAVTMASLFPANLRYSGLGLSYSLGIAIFGGFSPLLFTYLIKYFMDVKAPCYYLMACAIATFIATLRCNPPLFLKR